MTDPFLQAIRAAPHDDTPRLIYADWLEERGDPRGEFIRLQCALNRLPARDPAAPRLRERLQELLSRYETEWVGPLPALVRAWSFHRGFITEVTLTARQFLDHAGELFERLPLHGVRFCEARRWGARLAASPYLGRLDALDLRVNYNLWRGYPVGFLGSVTLAEMNDVIELFDLQALLASPHLTNLRSLNLDNLRLGSAAARAVAAAPNLAGLRRLDLDANQIGDEGVTVLARCPYLRRLKVLSLGYNGITARGVETLAASPHLGRLRCLSLRDNGIGSFRDTKGGAHGVGVLAGTVLPSLRRLDLRGNGVSDADEAALRCRFGERVRC